MAGRGRIAIFILAIFLLPSIQIPEQEQEVEEWQSFSVSAETYNDFIGEFDDSLELEDRQLIAESRIGVFSSEGFTQTVDYLPRLNEPRDDLLLLIISDEVRLREARDSLESVDGLEIREFIAPSGLVVQGTDYALISSSRMQFIDSIHAVPLAMIIENALLQGAIDGAQIRIESWRDSSGLLPGVDLLDDYGGKIWQPISSVAKSTMMDPMGIDTGRFSGALGKGELVEIATQPSVAWVRLEPQFGIFNDNSRNHMNINTMRSHFTTDLDGSGQIVAVADSGLDSDHGDFGNRVVGEYDVIGDGSTADKHSGHGTHVACTVLGDGTRGGYSGVAPEADLYFQAMENDNTGNFHSPSLNSIINTAYSAGARIHTNSWGDKGSSTHGDYTSESEDIDDRANTYDRYYNGKQGMVILFAAGNDGPNSGTIGAPSTAKNTITVGNHQNRYSGAPNTIMDGSSRGPTDDGRIKPDLVAPGGYVRSCRAQEAADTGGASWSNSWYLEYTGTSMATPNAAGSAALVREYLTEIAQRPEPQGALVKAILVLGAQDIGNRDIPNNEEGWGRIDLKNSLSPSGGRGIWVDDRSVLSNTGNSKEYIFNVTQSGWPLKAVLSWSDERGSRWSNKQLVNNLDLEMEAPDGTIYKGNVFSQGRSIAGGNADTVNNLEVALLDSVVSGIWKVRVVDSGHSGGTAQPFAIAVSGQGVNDLRPDPTVEISSLERDIDIPQVGDEVTFNLELRNLGNVGADACVVDFLVDGVEVDTDSVDLGPGAIRFLTWKWTPSQPGEHDVTFVVDPDDLIEEIRENNNQITSVVDVTTPGVKIESENPSMIVENVERTTTSWNVTLTNTALLSTNATLESTGVTLESTSEVKNWFVGLSSNSAELAGKEGVEITVTLVHPAPPEPGIYLIGLLGKDTDNDVTYPFVLELRVPNVPDAELELDYQQIPLHPIENTSIEFRFKNNGNADIGYDLFLEASPSWRAGFENLGSIPGASSGSTGLMLEGETRAVSISFTPPQVMTAAGAELMMRLRAVSQTETPQSWTFDMPSKVLSISDLSIDIETSFGIQRPDSELTLQFSISNTGNTDLDLQPTIQPPNGWEVDSIQRFDLAWLEDKTLRLNLTGDGNAKTGDLLIHLDSEGQRFTWTGRIEVVKLPEPKLTFMDVLLEDGSRWNHPLGPGSHPLEEGIVFSWLLENEVDVIWAANSKLTMDEGLFGECDDPDPVTKGSPTTLTCTILIVKGVEPKSQPGFTVELSADGVSIEEGISLYVASIEEVKWEDKQQINLSAGEQREIKVTVENTGNVDIDARLELAPPEGWQVSLTSSDLITLAPGEKEKISLKVMSESGGEGSLKVKLITAEETMSTEILLSAKSPDNSKSSNSDSSVFIWVGMILVILVLFGLVIHTMNRKQQVVKKQHPSISPSSSTNVSCWVCTKQIVGPQQGCPKCGARYHSEGTEGCAISSLEQCRNCGLEKTSFIDVI